MKTHFLPILESNQYIAKRLNVEADVRIQLSSVKPYINEICKIKSNVTVFTKLCSVL